MKTESSSITTSEKFSHSLQEELRQAEKRLAVAEAIMERVRKVLVCFMDGTLVDDIDLMDDLNGFLAHTPTDFVVVKREDLEKVLKININSHVGSPYINTTYISEVYIKSYDRLKAACKGVEK